MSDIANHPLLIEGKINNSFSHKDTIMARQTPWGAIENGGFENPTLYPWYGTGRLYTDAAFVGRQYCFLYTDSYIAQYTLPLDTSRDYRLNFYMARFTENTSGSVYLNFSADINYEALIPMTEIPFYRYRQVIFTIPVSRLTFSDTPPYGVIFIGIRNFGYAGVDQVFLNPIISIDPPIRE
ncbi:hypothetical protein [Desulforamulus aquiferis]|uniref:Malectin domain-containing protein n=1 Tax=Desulforamulus aquiferis TaxID=1397668 RepID=A0AAW7ZB33_9FIRM|nr:hypothetical protein [Desulforamulus aquiferis]MDO7786597.1 hypothetical protein [Desulforamulus aquiferis]